MNVLNASIHIAYYILNDVLHGFNTVFYKLISICILKKTCIPLWAFKIPFCFDKSVTTYTLQRCKDPELKNKCCQIQ